MLRILLLSFSLLLILNTNLFGQNAEALIAQAEENYGTDLSLAMSYAEQALEAAREESDLKHEARAQFLIGVLHYQTGATDSARYYLHAFLESGGTEQWLKYHARVYSWLAAMAIEEDAWPDALQYANLGHESAVQFADTTRIVEHLNYQGEIYRNINPNDGTRPLLYFKEALALAELFRDADLILYGYNYVGAAFEVEQQMDSAIHYYRKTIALAEATNDLFAAGQAHHNLALINIHEKQWEAARQHDQQALSYFRTEEGLIPTKGYRATCYIELANIALHLGNPLVAQKYIDSTRAIAVNSGFLASYIHKVEAEVMAIQQRWQAAYTLLKLHEQEEDSTLNSETAERVTSLFEWYEHEKNQREIAQLELDKERINLTNSTLTLERERAESDRNTLLLITLLTSTLLLGAILWLLQRRRTSQAQQQLAEAELARKETEARQLADELEIKKQSLASYSLLLAQKNDALLEFKEKLAEPEAPSPKALLHQVNQCISVDQDWAQFNQLFEEVNNGFFDRLRAIAPELTPNDLRLCALLKMNLSSKQIAAVLSIAPRSVDMARSRLRKKLGLDTKANLIDYLTTVDEAKEDLLAVSN